MMETGTLDAARVGIEETLPSSCAGSWPARVEQTPPALSPGERLAGTPYLVVRQLGRGGMGEVYEVEHAALGRRAALKVLHRDHQDRPDLAARLREEARLCARLRHPNLVEVFDLGVTAEHPDLGLAVGSRLAASLA